MDELNFHRPENDGRNQCLSLSPYGVEYPNGDPLRCVLEKNHTLEHACDGYLWTDDEALVLTKSNKILISSLLVVAAINLFMIIYSLYSLFTNPNGEPPEWYKITSPTVFVVAVVLFIIYGRRKFPRG